MKKFLFIIVTSLLIIPSIVSAEAAPCSQEKINTVLASATSGSQEVSIDCKLTLKATDKITKRVVFRGAESNGAVLSCNGATVDPTYGINAIVVASKQTSTSTPPIGEWSAPYDVRVTGCSVTGSIIVSGVPNVNGSGIFATSSRLTGHTKRVQDAAPSKILFASLTITADGDSALYVAPGSTNVTLKNSRLRGYSSGPVVYLDAESSYNVIQNNIFETDTTRAGTSILGGLFVVPSESSREIIAIDGSSYNKIIGNYFAELDEGGIFIYRNCGEGGVVRHQTPNHNQIINNKFYYNSFNGSKPSINIDSRNGNKSYCDLDKGFPFGSSVSDLDYATDTVVIKNRIHKFAPSTMIWTHGSPADIRLNETTPAGSAFSERTSQCYDIESKTVYEHDATRAVSGAVFTCKDGMWISPLVGYLNPLKDLKGQYQLDGWACIKASQKSVNVDLYMGGQAGVGTFFRTVSANGTTTSAINTQCGTAGVPHTFSYRLTAKEANANKDKTVFAYGMSGIVGVENEVLNGSGFRIPKAAPTSSAATSTTSTSTIKSAPASSVVSGKSPVLTTVFTANGATNLTVNAGDSVNYLWSSTGGTSWSSAYTATNCSKPAQNGTRPLGIKNAKGKLSSVLKAASAGCNYVLTYTAAGPGGAATSTVYMNVNATSSPQAISSNQMANVIASGTPSFLERISNFFKAGK